MFGEQIEFSEPVVVQQLTTQGGSKLDDFDTPTFVKSYELLFGDDRNSLTSVGVSVKYVNGLVNI